MNKAMSGLAPQMSIIKYYARSNLSEAMQAVIGPNYLISDVWTVFNPKVVEVNFGEVDYTSEDVNVIKVKIAYDTAILDHKIY